MTADHSGHQHDHHHDHHNGHDHGQAPHTGGEPEPPQDGGALNRLAVTATIHCLTGCAIGEVAGMVIGTGLGLHSGATVAISIILAFITGFSLTMLPLLRAGLSRREAMKIAFAADAASITVMEIVNNLLMLLIPGAMAAGPMTLLFWGSMIISLAISGLAAFPVNRWLIARGRGHAVVHAHHNH